MKNVLVISGFGINSDKETAYAFELAGTKTRIEHINTIIENPKKLDEFQIIVFPGGFSYGDHLGSGFAFASLIYITIFPKILELIEKGVLFIGICNGCQILTKLGLFNYITDQRKSLISIKQNKDNIGYRCIWTECEASEKFFGNINNINLPIAHGEGCFIDLDENRSSEEKKELLSENFINENCQIILKYKDNPNGAVYNTAGIANAKGNVIALMPHAERAIIYDKFNKEKNTNSSILQKNSLLWENLLYVKFFKSFINNG